MQLYHFSNGQYKNLIPQIGPRRTREEDIQLRDKPCIWFTTNSMGANGQQNTYIYTVDFDEEDPKLIKDVGSSTANSAWYGYLDVIPIDLVSRDVRSETYCDIKRFRKAIERLNQNEIGESHWFNQFPQGCSDDSAYLLAKYLSSKCIDVKYQCGIFECKNHAWLKTGNFIIDITADQYDDIEEDVIFTDNDCWYKKFKNPFMPNDIFRDFEGSNKSRLENLYNKIVGK